MAKRRDLFEEIREGLEAYRDNPDALRRRELSVPDVKAIREQFGLPDQAVEGRGRRKLPFP